MDFSGRRKVCDISLGCLIFKVVVLSRALLADGPLSLVINGGCWPHLAPWSMVTRGAPIIISHQYSLFIRPQNIRLIMICHYKCPLYHGYSRPPGDKCPCNCGFIELTMSSARGYTAFETRDLFINNVNNFNEKLPQKDEKHSFKRLNTYTGEQILNKYTV